MSNTETNRAPSRYRVSRKLNRFLAKKLNVPRLPAIRLSRAVNRALGLFTASARSRQSREIVRTVAPAWEIERTKGYRFIDTGELPEIGPAIKQARQIYQRAATTKSADKGESLKAYIMTPADPRTIGESNDIMRLVLARPLLDAVTKYLGEVPIVSHAEVFVSLPSDTQTGSQLYHLDHADESQIKLFVYVDEVTDENGPFTFVPVSGTQKLIRDLGYDRGRLTPEEVVRALGKEGQIKVTGPAGTAVAVDTSQCMHFGSNRNKAPRVVLLIQYVSHAVPEKVPVKWPAAEITDRLGLDDVQTLALTL